MAPPTDPPPPGTPAPQILDSRIWIDGCFDFFHHGHAGAIVQARALGTTLYVGIHSDASILENKGPTVMTMAERVSAVDACRWVTASIPDAPYVTSLPWITHYGCRYVVHGDDITSDSSGEDCYRFVKEAGRFKVVKRTPSISTTDLVGRMLLCTKGHFVKSLKAVLEGREGGSDEGERRKVGVQMRARIALYATDASALRPGADVWFWSASLKAKTEALGPGTGNGNGMDDDEGETGELSCLVEGPRPKPGQRVVYVDGGFDLFSSGHIQFLRKVLEAEEELARGDGWYDAQNVNERRGKGEDYGPAFVVAGVHDDEVINAWKGVNYPIMNVYERGLCVLQCKYINAVVFGAPFSPTKSYLTSLPHGTPDAVYHGPTSFMPLTYDPYVAPKAMGIYREIGHHEYEDVNAGTIVQRILKSRDLYEERQRAKGMKAEMEEAARLREQEDKNAYVGASA